MTTKNRKHFAEAFDPLDDALLEADQAEGIIDHVIDEVSRPLDDRGEDADPPAGRVKWIEGLIEDLDDTIISGAIELRDILVARRDRLVADLMTAPGR